MKISNLKRTKDGAVRVELEDGAAFRVSDGAVLELGLCRGLELDGDGYAALRKTAGRESSRAYALRTVSRRALSEKELRRKLENRGCEERETEEIILWLRTLGAVNDELLAENLARHYSQKSYGRRGIAAELRKRGIPEEAARRAIEETETDNTGIDAFVVAKLRGKTPDKKDLSRVAQMLLRRGHGWNDIKDALGRYERDLEE